MYYYNAPTTYRRASRDVNDHIFFLLIFVRETNERTVIYCDIISRPEGWFGNYDSPKCFLNCQILNDTYFFIICKSIITYDSLIKK